MFFMGDLNSLHSRMQMVKSKASFNLFPCDFGIFLRASIILRNQIEDL